MLIVRLLAFALGAIFAIVLHSGAKVSLLWSAVAAIAFYIAAGLLMERIFFGALYAGW